MTASQLPGDELWVDGYNSQILDKAYRWFDLARHTIDDRVGDTWIVDLSDSRDADLSLDA